MAVNNKIQLRRGTSSSWETSNPTLLSGEAGYSSDLNRIKIGNGTTAWNDLAYLASEAFSLVTTVFNNTGSSIPKLRAVYINGGQGDQPTVALARANSESRSSKTYGITAEAIPNMSTGKVIVSGALIKADTDQFNPTAPSGNVNGTTLWLSPTVAGRLTTTKPSAPNHMVAMGTIVRTDQNEGIVEVKVQDGFELQELNNVSLNEITGGEFLSYNGVTSLWIANPNLFSSGNNIGIGITSPTTTLQINGSFSCGYGGDPSAGDQGLYIDPDTPLLRFNDSGPNTVADIDVNGLTLYDFSSSPFFYTDRNNARIGIGTATPSETLDVNGTFKSAGFKSYGIGWFGASDGSLGLGVNTNPVGTFDSSSDFVALQGFNDVISTYNPICLTAQNAAQLYLNTDGNVGIGTATPSEKLHVLGISLFANEVKIGSLGNDPGILNVYTNDASDSAAQINLKNGDSVDRLSFSVNDDNDESAILSTSEILSINNNSYNSTMNIGANTINLNGNVTFVSFTESVVTIGNSSTSQTIDLTSGTVQTCTLTGNCTFTMPTATAGKSFTLFLNSGAGNYTAIFTAVRWADSATPTATILANKVDIYSFISDGTYWYGSFSQNYG